MSAVTTIQLEAALEACFKVGQSAVVLSGPGMGKTETVIGLLKRLGMWHELLPVSGLQPVDVTGPPIIIEIDGEKFSTFAPPEFFHRLNERARTEGDGCLFIDELTSGDMQVQRTCLSILNHNALPSGYVLDPRIHVVATGNLPTDGSGVRALSTPLTNRCVVFELIFDADAWRAWAIAKEIDPRFIGFASWRPSMLHHFDGAVRGPQSTPRSIVGYARIAASVTPEGEKHSPATIETRRLIGEGLVGEGCAAEVEHFLKVSENLPKRDEIMRDPNGTRVPDVSSEVDVLYALTCMLAHTVNGEDGSADPIFQYVSRFPSEFQRLFVTDSLAKHPELHADPAYSQWVRDNK